jgi:putative nucleotidyltransferase with HDIG domain
MNIVNLPMLVTLILLGVVVFILVSMLRKSREVTILKEMLNNLSNKQGVYPKPRQEKASFSVNDDLLDNLIEQKTILQQQLSKIIGSARQFALELNIDSACDIIFEEIDKLFFVKKIVMLFFDKTSQSLYVKHAFGLDQDAREEIKNLRLKIGESISGSVAKNRQPLMVQKFDNEGYYQKIDKEKYFSGSFISLPIFTKDELLGIINVIDKKSGSVFEKSDLSLIEGVIAIATIVLKNIQLNRQVQEDYVNIIITLAKTLDARDHYTNSHSENVERISVLLAKEMGLSNPEVEYIHRAALLHDIGKIAIADNILNKPASLTKEEYEVIKTHPVRSEEIISSISFLEDSTKIVRHHHERYDGKGYPDGISGDKIELGARIINVADAYDAMTSDRTYRKALSKEQAVGELVKGKGTQFDPKIVDVFLKITESKELA